MNCMITQVLRQTALYDDRYLFIQLEALIWARLPSRSSGDQPSHGASGPAHGALRTFEKSVSILGFDRLHSEHAFRSLCSFIVDLDLISTFCEI